jgi:hypothetical protein
VLLPLGGWMIKRQEDEIAACRRNIADATRPNGLLMQIGSLMRKVEVVALNKRSMSDAIKSPGQYFEDQILAAGGSGLKNVDFVPSPPKEEKQTIGAKQRVADHVVDIAFTRKDLFVPLDFVFAVIWNCESGARVNADQVQQSVWKLRELTIDNATDERLLRDKRTPPAELADKWSIKKLAFARREPTK